MNTRLTEPTVEDAALAWLGNLGWSPAHGPEIENNDWPAAKDAAP